VAGKILSALFPNKEFTGKGRVLRLMPLAKEQLVGEIATFDKSSFWAGTTIAIGQRYFYRR
jgi:hypothetical protein